MPEIVPRPIEDIKTTLHTTNRNINQIKIDMITMKSDLSIIKDYIKKQERERLLQQQKDNQKASDIQTGWFWSS